MFKKRNFSLIHSPSSNDQRAAPKFNSPAKRTRLLSSTLRTPNLFLQQETTKDNSVDRSPLFQRLSESLNLGNKHQLTTLLSDKDQSLEETLESAKTFLATEDVSYETTINCDQHYHTANQETTGLQNGDGAGRIDTPPPTPSTTIEPKIDILTKQKEELQKEIKRLDEQAEAKFSKIRSIRAETIELQTRDLIFDDHFDIVARSHLQVRNLLNEIYNPGSELGKRASHFIEEVRRRHHKKFEKVAFEMNHLIETSQEAIKKKFKELEHEIELHERTLMTIECQKRHEQSQKVERETEEPVEEEVEVEIEIEADIGAGAEAEVQAEAEQESKSNNDVPVCDKSQNNEDDCIIIEDNDATQSEVANEVELTAHTPEPQDVETNMSGCNNSGDNTSGGNNSLTTVTYDDEETDIDEPKEDEEPRSFTPCQAQRPN